MPPIKTGKTEGTDSYSIPFLGSINEKLSENLDVSALDGSAWLDDNNMLKAGTPLVLDGKKLVPVSEAGQTIRGLLIESTPVGEKGDAVADIDDFDVVTVVNCTVDRGILESNKGEALSDDELEAINNNDAITLTDPYS